MMKTGGHRLLVAAVCAVVGVLVARGARADDDGAALFSSATKALHEGRAGDAIGALEALADQGVVDPVASYDRGLAYAMRVHIGAGAPGDLGRAAQGFEEARDLSRDGRLVDDASRALTAIRSEVARRRTSAGEPVEVDPARSLGRAVAGLLSEDVWANIGTAAAAFLGLGLFVQWLAKARRARVAGAVGAGVAAPVLLIAIVMTLAARSDRLNLREAVVVAPGVRPTDERGLVVPGATSLPEGARVEIIESRAASSRVRFGTIEAWVAGSALREIARRT
jgi:hypothetical protein